MDRPAATPDKPRDGFRDFGAGVRPEVREFYRLNHRHQTLDFVLEKKREYLPLGKRVMGVWEAMELMSTIGDDSDPDTELPQLDHSLQSAEAIRKDGHPDWLILVGLIHDLGKVLCAFGEPQWAVVGDSFPVGCAFSPAIVFSDLFADNEDTHVPAYQTAIGVYQEGCGLDNVHLAWGHDRYLYEVLKGYLPDEALYMIRYHSFYAAHHEGAYGILMNDRDRAQLPLVRAFSAYDLYSKTPERPDPSRLRPFYEQLVARYLPPALRW